VLSFTLAFWRGVNTPSQLTVKHKVIAKYYTRAQMGEMIKAHKILVGNRKGKDHSEDLGVDGKVIFNWILKIQAGRGIDSSGSG
jgi:hypothetical protein